VFRNEFEYRSDDLQFGDDVYQDNTVCGDCEDYALTLAKSAERRRPGRRLSWR
jgi:thymidine kinase